MVPDDVTPEEIDRDTKKTLGHGHESWGSMKHLPLAASGIPPIPEHSSQERCLNTAGNKTKENNNEGKASFNEVPF